LKPWTIQHDFDALFPPQDRAASDSLKPAVLSSVDACNGHVLITEIARETIDPYEGISACLSKVNLREVQRTLVIPWRMVRASVMPEPLQRTGSPWFRNCR